jgi:uncharacterized cupin superfamily protein
VKRKPKEVDVEANIFTSQFDEDIRGLAKRARLGRHAGTERIGLSLYELGPRCPREVSKYHLQYANEELLIVLSGTPTLRTPSGERHLKEGEVVAFPAGRQGAHQVFNETDEPVRYLMLSTMNAPDVMEYPDDGKIGVISRPPGSQADEDEFAAWFRLSDQVGYWD